MAVDAPAVRTGRFVEVQPGVRLHCAEAGEPGRPLLLFVHGFPEFWYAWKDVLPAFADGWHAVAPDLRGFNLSDKPTDPTAYRPATLVADLEGLIRALGHDSAVVVAHDWGGALAWSLAIAMPQRVSRLVILNAPHPLPFSRALASDPAQQRASAYMNFLRSPGAERALAKDDFAAMDRFFLDVSAAPWFDATPRAAYHEAWSRPGALSGGLAYYRASPLYPPTDEDPGARRLQLDPADFVVRVPTRVIWGEKDRALLPTLLDGLETVVPLLDVVRLPECSHWLVHEAPDRIVGLIREFAGAPG